MSGTQELHDDPQASFAFEELLIGDMRQLLQEQHSTQTQRSLLIMLDALHEHLSSRFADSQMDCLLSWFAGTSPHRLRQPELTQSDPVGL
jgi:hypothetical protein